MTSVRLYSRVPIEPIPGIQIITDPKPINAMKGKVAESLSGLCRASGVRSSYIRDGLATASFIFFLFDSTPRLVGFAIVYSESDKAFVHSICTEENTSGYGSQLLRAVETVAKKVGKSKIQLESEDDVVPFYEKNGYKNIGVSEEDEDSFVMEKAIPIGGKRRKTLRRRTARTSGRKRI